MSNDEFLKKFYSDQINRIGYSGAIPNNLQDLEKLYEDLQHQKQKNQRDEQIKEKEKLKKIQEKRQKILQIKEQKNNPNKETYIRNKPDGSSMRPPTDVPANPQYAYDEAFREILQSSKNNPKKHKIRKNHKLTAEEIQSIIKQDELVQKHYETQISEFPLELLSELDSIEGKGNLAKFRNDNFVDHLKICDYFISHITQDQTDEEIASSTGLRINMVRRVLYDLFGKGLITGVRVKDERNSRFVYRWRWRTSEPVYGSNGNVLKIEKTMDPTEYRLYLENEIQISNQNKLDGDDTKKDDYAQAR